MEWWRAGEIDDFQFKNKMLRVGCRPLKRKHLACMASVEEQGYGKFMECKKMRTDLDECYKALNYIHLAENRQDID